jgi:hypothetical protein
LDGDRTSLTSAFIEERQSELCTAEIRHKRFAMSSGCMRVTNVATPRLAWTWWPMLLGLSVWSWPTACLALGLSSALLGFQVIVEAQRRRTLLALMRQAPAGSVVVMTGTSELPAMQVRIGPGSETTRGTEDAA